MAANVEQRAADQRALNTFAVWMAWAVSSLTVFIMMYREANVLSFIQHDNTRVTWIILGMFALGLGVSFYQAMRLTGEWFRAYRVEIMVRKDGLSSVKVIGRHLVDRFIGALRTIIDQNGRLDVETLVEVEFSSQHRLSQFVALLGNLMITLGLIGTVLGMTITMNGLHSALSELGVDQDLLLEGLRSAMNGMGVAFYTTLMGAVLGGVLLRVFSWITDASVNGLQDLMLRTCIVYASADLEPSEARDLKAMESAVEHLGRKTAMLQETMKASREEMHALREEAAGMYAEMREFAENDPVQKLAVGHAKYALGVRPGLFRRIFLRRKD